jgi:hypothetical protein
MNQMNYKSAGDNYHCGKLFCRAVNHRYSDSHHGRSIGTPRANELNWELISVQEGRKLICVYPEKGLD